MWPRQPLSAWELWSTFITCLPICWSVMRALHRRLTVSTQKLEKRPFLAFFTPRTKLCQVDHTPRRVHPKLAAQTGRTGKPHSSNDGGSGSGYLACPAFTAVPSGGRTSSEQDFGYYFWLPSLPSWIWLLNLSSWILFHMRRGRWITKLTRFQLQGPALTRALARPWEGPGNAGMGSCTLVRFAKVK